MPKDRILFINTDEKHSRGATRRMLAAQVAAVWGGEGKQEKKLRARRAAPGEVIYAYQSGAGVVARGVVVDGEVFRAPAEQSVFPECADGDEWHLRVEWTRHPKGAVISEAVALEATGEHISTQHSVYAKEQRVVIDYLDNEWGLTRRLPPRHWGILCLPETYDIEAAIQVLTEDTWNIPKGRPSPGDRLLFWKAKGIKSDRRGVVALGEVLTRPAMIHACPESAPFWPGGLPEEPMRGIEVHFVVPPGAPLWEHDDHEGLFQDLSVARVRGGNKLYNVTLQQWNRIVAALGGWPEIDTSPTADPGELDRRVQQLLRSRSGKLPKPKGQTKPKKRDHAGGSAYERDPGVKAWVLREAEGICECCGKPGPFLTDLGVPFLEVHHVQWLSLGGPDVIENAAATCPNCHRELHLGRDRGGLTAGLYKRVDRLSMS